MPDRTNRIVLGLLGLLLLAAGVATLLAGTRLFGEGVPDRSLVDNAVADFIGRNGAWFWPVLGLVALILAALVIWWLAKILFPTGGVGEVDVPARGRGARTTLVAGALTDAVSHEIEGYRGVGSARANLFGTSDRPALSVSVDTDRAADLAALRYQIESGALTNARLALDRPDLPVTLDLTVRRRDGARVG